MIYSCKEKCRCFFSKNRLAFLRHLFHTEKSQCSLVDFVEVYPNLYCFCGNTDKKLRTWFFIWRQGRLLHCSARKVIEEIVVNEWVTLFFPAFHLSAILNIHTPKDNFLQIFWTWVNHWPKVIFSNKPIKSESQGK